MTAGYVGKRLGLWCVGVLFAALLIWPRFEDYSLQLRLRQDRTGQHMQIYWKTEEGEYTDKNSYKAAILGQDIYIPVQRGMLGWDVEWRLDPMDANLDLGISSFDLYKGEKWRKNFSADDLAAMVKGQEQIDTVYSVGEDYYIRPSGESASLFLGNTLSRIIVRHILLHYLLSLAQASAVLALFAAGDSLPGVRGLYRWAGRQLGQIGNGVREEPGRLLALGMVFLPLAVGTLAAESGIYYIDRSYILRLLLGGGLLILIIWADRLPGIRNLYTVFQRAVSREKPAFGVFCLLLGSLILLLFHPMLLGERVFVYSGDSLYQTYPGLAHAADRIAAGEWGRGYTFYESLGKAEAPLLLNLRNFCALFGRENLGAAMGFAHMLKILFSGLFFYGFLRRMGTEKLGCFLLSLGYACNSYMIARGMWQNYPNEALCLAIWLWGFEGFKTGKCWLSFLFVNLFCCWNYNGYSIILYTGIGLLYGVFRLVSEREKQEPLRLLLKKTGALVGSMAAGAAAAWTAWLPSLMKMLGSDRVRLGAESASQPGSVFSFADLPVWRTMFYRMLSPDSLGMWSDTYSGTANWLEDPVYYCGLAAVVFLPLGFSVMSGAKKRWYLLPLAGALLYNASDGLRNLANGFSGTGWKLSSLWVIVCMLLVTAALWQGNPPPKPAGGGAILVLTNLGLTGVSVIFYGEGVQRPYLWAAISFCLLFSLLLFFLWREKEGERQQYLQYLLVMAAAAEVFCSSYRIINNEAAVDPKYLKESGYEDGTAEILAVIEDPDFYRVDKQFTPVSACDSLYQRYRGTASYIGGVGDSRYTRRLYQYLELPVLEHVQMGTDKSTVVDALFNVRYVLARGEEISTFGLNLLKKEGELSLYKNQYALPFGYVYHSWIPEEEAWGYGAGDRRLLMLEQCILGEEAMARLPSGIVKGQGRTEFRERWGDYRREISLGEREITFEPAEKGQVIVVQAVTEADAEAWCRMYCMEGNSIRMENSVRLARGRAEHFEEFRAEGAGRILLQAEGEQPFRLAGAELYVIPEEIYFAEYVKLTEERSRGGLAMEYFSEERMEGRASLEKDSIMVFTIPYDENWRVYVNGEERELFLANIGFMGLALEAGDYEIRLEYQ